MAESGVTTGGAASAAGKRKRATQHAAETRASKRAPAANMSPVQTDAQTHVFDTSLETAHAAHETEAAHAAHAAQAVHQAAQAAHAAQAAQAAQAAHAAIESGNHGVPDLSALQQATAEHPQHAEGSDATSAATAATAAAAALSLYPGIHIAPTEEQQYPPPGGEGQHGQENAYPPPPGEGHHADQHGDPHAEAQHLADGLMDRGEMSGYANRQHDGRPSHKPTVGSQEWHQLRKDNHKEVERRRRETINEGINELSKIVPGCEKNKGSILQRAVAFIMQLKEQEAQHLEKYTLEKLLTEQALAELGSSNEKLKIECERLYRELETWKRVAKNAGVQPPMTKEEAGGASAADNAAE